MSVNSSGVASSPALTAGALAALGQTAATSAESALRSWDECSAASVAFLGSVPKSDFRELKAFAKPARLIQETAAVALKLLGYTKTDDWRSFQAALANPQTVVEKIASYDVDSAAAGGDGVEKSVARLLNDRAALEQLLQSPVTDPDQVKRASMAMAGVSMWLRAVVEYRLERLV